MLPSTLGTADEVLLYLEHQVGPIQGVSLYYNKEIEELYCDDFLSPMISLYHAEFVARRIAARRIARFRKRSVVPLVSTWKRNARDLARLRALLPANEYDQCCVCYDRPADTLLLPCGHDGTCLQCSLKVVDCPLCRARIRSWVSFGF
jgi:hypothetical protein